MKKKNYLHPFFKLIMNAFLFELFISNVNAQNTFPSNGSAGIGTTTPNASAKLEIKSTTKGFLGPRMTQSQRNAISSPATGLLIYQTDNTPGFYYYNGGWKAIGSATTSGWSLTGNSGTDSSKNFLGTKDAHPLVFRVNNKKAGYIDYNGNDNTSFGYQGLFSNTTGFLNTAIGTATLKTNTTGGRNTSIGAFTLVANNADNNTAIGTYALGVNTSGTGNAATGVNALAFNTNGNYNSAFGTNTLYSNTAGIENVANGYGALFSNVAGNDNAAFGKYALYNNNANYNTALGYNSMFFNTTGTNNTATGSIALQNNTTSSNNTANGYAALYSNNGGSENTAFGVSSLYANISGSNNTAAGFGALNSNTANNNTATGAYALYLNTSGGSNTANGYEALYQNTTGSNNTANGLGALTFNSQGSNNTAGGFKALYSNTMGGNNTALGVTALYSNDQGTGNTAVGLEALHFNKDGSYNTAMGVDALLSNETGIYNSAFGYNSLLSNIDGNNNTAMGMDALNGNTAGNNSAFGYRALYKNTTGDNNVAIGVGTMFFNNSGGGNVAVGSNTLQNNQTGNNNTAIGVLAGTNGSLNYTTAIGTGALTTASNQIRVGSIGSAGDPTSIGGKVGWSTLSDGRVKKNIKENVPGLTFINKLKPITYNIDNNIIDKITQHSSMKDEDGNEAKPSANDLAAVKVNAAIIYTGFVAQDVEKAAKSLNYDFSGVDAAKNDKDLYGLRYSDFVVPLVKAVQELSAKNDDLQKQIDQLKSTMLSDNPSIKNTGLSSASLEQNKPNPYTNNTTIGYILPGKFVSAQIIISDKSGKTLKAVNVSGSGKRSLNVDTATLPSGAYNYSLFVDSKLIATKQMMLTK